MPPLSPVTALRAPLLHPGRPPALNNVFLPTVFFQIRPVPLPLPAPPWSPSLFSTVPLSPLTHFISTVCPICTYSCPLLLPSRPSASCLPHRPFLSWRAAASQTSGTLLSHVKANTRAASSLRTQDNFLVYKGSAGATKACGPLNYNSHHDPRPAKCHPQPRPPPRGAGPGGDVVVVGSESPSGTPPPPPPPNDPSLPQVRMSITPAI